MAGQIAPVIPRQTFAFSLTSGSFASETVLAKEIPVVGMREAQLLVRVHKDMAVSGTEPTVNVKVQAVSPSPDEPALEFVYGGPASPTALATQALTAATAKQGTLFIKPIHLDPGGSPSILGSFASHLRVVLSVSGAATGAVTDLTISADIVAKS